jgi:cyclopropane fatty-acyl-phospholipid synthase-like methyltransferase
VREISTPLSFQQTEHANKAINKDILEQNNSMDEMDLRDINRVFQPVTADCIFFSEAHETFSKIDHILGHKASLNKYKKLK